MARGVVVRWEQFGGKNVGVRPGARRGPVAAATTVAVDQAAFQGRMPPSLRLRLGGQAGLDMLPWRESDRPMANDYQDVIGELRGAGSDHT